MQELTFYRVLFFLVFLALVVFEMWYCISTPQEKVQQTLDRKIKLIWWSGLIWLIVYPLAGIVAGLYFLAGVLTP